MGGERKQHLGQAAIGGSRHLVSSITRVSLIAQTADVIRQRVTDGTWTDQLPGERKLCDLLQVSRPTLRRALKILQQEGLFLVSQGKHRAISLQDPPAEDKPSRSREVIILSPVPSSGMPASTHYLIEEIYTSLQKAGYQLRIESPAWLRYRQPSSYLAEHVATEQAACWALFSVSESVQQWFSQQSIPALVSGSCYSGVGLPSIDFDYSAVVKHAVGTFFRKGYKHITLLVPENLRAGDATTMEAFLEAIGQKSTREMESRVLRVSQNQGKFDLQLREILKATHLPQALFIAGALNALYVLTFLLQHGYKIGTDVGLICRDEDFYFEHLSLKPTRYRINKEKFATRFCRMLLKLAQSGTYPLPPVLITPEFLEGETV